MALKTIDVDSKKWTDFGKWCVNHDTTIKKEIDNFLDRFEVD